MMSIRQGNIGYPYGALPLSTSILSRFALVILTVWGLSMVLPSFHRMIWPLASFGLAVDNNSVVVDLVGPFDHLQDSPAATSGLAVGDQIDLQQMNCWRPSAQVCAALVTVLGGSAGVKETVPGRVVGRVIRPPTRGGS